MSPIEQNALVHLWRRRTRVYPQNPIAWVELARHEMLRGKTRDSIDRCQLLCNSLLTIDTCFARQRGYICTPTTPNAVTTRWSKAGRRPMTPGCCPARSCSLNWLKGTHNSRDKLASRRGWRPGLPADHGISRYAGHGRAQQRQSKKARRLFARSLQDPNGNALAQAEWASPAFGTESLHPGASKMSKSHLKRGHFISSVKTV